MSVITFDCAGMNNSLTCNHVSLPPSFHSRILKGNFVAATAPPIWEFHPKEMKKASHYDGGKIRQEMRVLRPRRAGFDGEVLAHSQSISRIHEQDKTVNNFLIISKEKQTQVINHSWIITGRFLHTSNR